MKLTGETPADCSGIWLKKFGFSNYPLINNFSFSSSQVVSFFGGFYLGGFCLGMASHNLNAACLSLVISS